MKQSSRRLLPCAAMLLTLCGLPALAGAQTAANVNVDAGSSLGAIPPAAFGANTAVWDGFMTDPVLPSLLQGAGLTAIRYPGGSTSDVYHWQNNSSTDNSGQYVNPADTFDAFMTMAQASAASPIITVNYGSNQAGTAGGDPNEAAAWVDYSNNTKHYGVEYWEIGNEVYGNGEYGSAWETDYHTDHSPTAYGQNVVLYSNAMKAKDPTIKIGAVLAAPGYWPDGQTPDWNSNVLAQCGSNIDFVILHWYPQDPGNENDSYLLSSNNQLAAVIANTKALINKYCGTNAANVQIFVTETDSVAYNPGKQTVSLVSALYLADEYATWLENGVANVDWWNLHNAAQVFNNSPSLYGTTDYGDYGMFSSGQLDEPAAETPFPAYYGLQMLSFLGKSGDDMVASTSSQPLLATHAVKQANGDLALMLINKDPSNTCSATVDLTGYTPASTSTTYTYGENSTAITSGQTPTASDFTVSLPPYSVQTVVMQPSPVPPTWSETATVSSPVVCAGQTANINATFVSTGVAASNVIEDIEVYDSTGNKVGQTYNYVPTFAAGSTQTFSYAWTAPGTPGVYTVKLGVFNSSWQTLYAWNYQAVQFSVDSSATTKYSFETGTQGWATSGGLIPSIEASTAEAYDGVNSLEMDFSGTGSEGADVYVVPPSTLTAGKTITFYLWVPAGSTIYGLQPYAQQGAAGNWGWSSNWYNISQLQTNAWNTLSVTVPSNAVTPLNQIGVQFFTYGPWTGTAYLDAVSW